MAVKNQAKHPQFDNLANSSIPGLLHPLSVKAIRTLSLLLLALGAVVMFGWAINSSLLVQIHPDLVPMQFNTALCFSLTGLALYATLKLNEPLAIVSALIGMVLAGATLSQYLFNIDFGIDEFFLTHKITTLTSHPGRMSPNSAVCFILVNLAIVTEVLLWQEDYLRIRHYFFGGILLIISGAAVVGHLTDTRFAYGWIYSGMALHTSIGFFLAGSVITSLGIKQGALSKLQSRIYLSFLIFIACGIFSYFGAQLHKKYDIDSFINYYEERTNAATQKIQAQVESISRMQERLLAGWLVKPNKDALQEEMRKRIQAIDSINWFSLGTYYFDATGLPDKIILSERREGIVDTTLGLSKFDLAQGQLNKTRSWELHKNSNLYLISQFKDGDMTTILSSEVVLNKVIENTISEEIKNTFKVDIVDSHSLSLENDWLGANFIHSIHLGTLKKEIVFYNPDLRLYANSSYWYWTFGAGLVISLLMSLLCFFYLQVKGERKNLVSLINTMPVAVIGSHYDGSIVIANRAAERLFGYEEDELIGLSIENLVPIEAPRHEQLRERFIDDRKRRRMGTGSIAGLTKEGEKVTVEINLDFMEYEDQPVVLATIEDVKDRQSELRESVHTNQVLRQLFNKLDEGVIALNENGFCEFINKKGGDILGYNAAELLGNSFSTLVQHTDDTGKPKIKDSGEIWETLRNGSTHSVENDVFWHKSGQSIKVSFVVKPLMIPPYHCGAMLIFSEIG